MNLLKLYLSLKGNVSDCKCARALLTQAHWFASNVDFDPKTGDALPQALTSFLVKLAKPVPAAPLRDRLWRISEHARPAVERLTQTLNETPRREHALLPVRSVRELDACSFIKLSNRPGRTIREKLAGKPYLDAVRRFQSIDLPENRLLKAFLTRLVELFCLRRDYLGEQEDELLPRVHSWLLSDEGKAIGRWENLPPNNTLLAHRDYRRIWDAWRWMQTLDDDIARDYARLAAREETMRQWVEYGRMHQQGTHVFVEMPVLFDYEAFTIRTWSPEPIIQRVARGIDRTTGKRSVKQAVCLDLVEVHPRFAVAAGGSQALTETYLWQQWRNDADTVDIALFNSEAAYLHPDAITIGSRDLFFAGDKIPGPLLDRAARTFAARLRDTFNNDTLIWLVPDAVNDFELDIIRRNLNARFAGTEPLPRSVAALFKQVDYARVTGDGYSVVVVDTLGGITCATKLLARFDADLKNRLPETRGYYWERCPPVVLSKHDGINEQHYDTVTVDGTGKWHKKTISKRPQFIDLQHLKENPRIGPFQFCINLSKSPVAGGIRLHALQSRSGDIPLWRDQIPELAIKVMKGGHYQRFYLVPRGTTIKPIRGLSVQIPIEERFTLPAGKSYYKFPLFQGENAAELRFSARLDSPAFPLASDTECKLVLTFRYGEDEPYTLMFAPLDNSFPPVRATWQRTVEEILTDASAPGYPSPLSWEDLRRMPKPDGKETSDLLEWVVSAIDRLHRDLFCWRRKRTLGQITSDWRQAKNGKHFTFAQCSESNSVVFIHENDFVEGSCFENFKPGDYVSFKLEKHNSRFLAKQVAALDYWEARDGADNIVRNIRKRLYFPIIQVWRDGRSIFNEQCPEEFRLKATERIKLLASLLEMKELPEDVKREVLFLLSCLHKDAPDKCVDWLTKQVEAGNVCDPRAVGFALGDVSQKWQQDIVHRLASYPQSNAISVFAYAIWRKSNFVKHFTLSALNTLLPALLKRLVDVSSPKRVNAHDTDSLAIRKWARATAEPLELLLGLLRTRASDDPDIKMLLQPHQKITKKFAEQIDRIEDIIAESNITLFSRVKINIQKPKGVRTPDLIYALRLYLTGDDGANAICITGIADTDDD
jgi:hypothetical protein